MAVNFVYFAIFNRFSKITSAKIKLLGHNMAVSIINS